MTGKEIRIKGKMEAMGYQVLLPQEQSQIRRSGKWHKELRLLMPSYLFVEDTKDELEALDYYRIARLPDVIRILGNPSPLSLLPEEAEWIRLLSGNGKALEPSHVYLGQTVRIVSGLLIGREGQIVKLEPRRRRASLSISTLGVTHTISLGIEILSDPS